MHKDSRLAAAAIHGLHVGKQHRIRKGLAEGRNCVVDALELEKWRPEFHDIDASGKSRLGDDEALADRIDIDRNLETEVTNQPLPQRF